MKVATTLTNMTYAWEQQKHESVYSNSEYNPGLGTTEIRDMKVTTGIATLIQSWEQR